MNSLILHPSYGLNSTTVLLQGWYTIEQRHQTKESWQSENFRDLITSNIWTPNSPDWFDYYVQDVFERETNKAPGNIKDELKARITTAFSNSN